MHRKLEKKSDLCRSPKILCQVPGPQERSCRGAAVTKHGTACDERYASVLHSIGTPSPVGSTS